MVAIAGIPLAMAPGLFLGYDATPKLVLAYFAAGWLLLRAGRWWPGIVGLSRTSQGRLFGALLFAQALSVLLSAGLAQDRILAFGGASYRRWGALTQLVVLWIVAATAAHSSADRRFLRPLLVGIQLAGGLAALYGILQYFGWDPWLSPQLYTVRFTGDVIRPPATLRHALYFANFLLPVLLIAGSMLLREVRSRWRLFHAMVLSTCGAALVLTGTRSALLGLGAGAALAGYLEARRAGRRKTLLYAAAGLIAGLTLISIFALSPAGKSLRIRLVQWSADPLGGTRLLVWRDSGQLLRAHWLFGIGPEAFAGEFRKVQSLELSRAYPEHYHEDPHNMLLGAALSQGAPGLVLTLAWIGLGVICGVHGIRKGIPASGMLLACLLGMSISAQFAPLTITNWLYFDVTIALLVALGVERPPRGAAAAGLPSGVQPLQWTAALFVIVSALGYMAQDALVAATGRRLAQGDMAGARDAYALASRFPFSADHLWCSQQSAAVARSLRSPGREAALMLAKEASANAERGGEQRFSALYQSGVLAVITNDMPMAEAKLRAAVQSAPWWYRAHMMLAQVLWLAGPHEQARREANLALQCAGSSEPSVRLALDQARDRARPSP